MSRDNRVVAKLDDDELKMLDELAAVERMNRGQLIRVTIVREHRRLFPPRKIGTVEARRQAEKEARVVMRTGDERWQRYGERAYCVHVGLDGKLAWGPFRHPKPDEASRLPVTALELSNWRAANRDPPWDAREIGTAYDMERGILEASDPEDQAEFELRQRQKAGEA